MTPKKMTQPHSAIWHPVTEKVGGEAIIVRYACTECGQTVSVEMIRAGLLIDHRPAR